MSSDHSREIDPVTGYETTGHDWNGIKELNTPFPRIVIWALVLTFLYSVVAWVLLPAWPLGRDYTRGLLGVDQTTDAEAEHAGLVARRHGWTEQFAAGDFAALAKDTDLMAQAQPAAKRLFADNCAACHGSQARGRDGHGGPGFPSLVDNDWLWSSDPADIAELIRVGINSDHPDTNVSSMMAFGRDGMLTRDEIDLLVPYVGSLSTGHAETTGPAATLFADNCASCHGDDGTGGLGVGAPSLADDEWIYGGDPRSIRLTLMNGRTGTMPAWEHRLSVAERNLLTLYILGLKTEDAQ